MTEQYSYEQSSVIVDELDIISYDGATRRTLKGKYTAFSLTESLFGNTMYGSISILDGVGLMEDLPIIGEETLSVRFKTSPSSDEMFKEFRIYSLEKAVLVKEQGAMAYQLKFVSPEFFTNEKKRVRRSYKNVKAIDIVQDLSSMLDASVLNVGDWDDTSGAQNIVISNLKPLQGINMACNLAKSSDGNASLYTFFENRDGFYFKDIEKLYSQHPTTILTRKYTQSEQSSESPLDSLNQILSFSIEKQFDHLNSLNKGMFKNKTIGFDPLVKSVKEVTFDYSKQFSELKHIGNGFPLTSDQFDKLDDVQQIKLVNSRSLRNKSEYFRGKNGDPSFEKTFEDMFPYRMSAYQQLESNRLNVTVPGNTELTVGLVVDIDVPSYRLSYFGDGPERHRTLSGSYLITVITHNFSGGKYTMDLMLQKDVYSEEQKTRSTLIKDPQ